jgi:integrase
MVVNATTVASAIWFETETGLCIGMVKAFYVYLNTKTVRRNVPLNDTAAGILKRRLILKASRYVFCNHQGKRIPQLTKAFWTAVAEAGLERIEVDSAGKEKKIRFRFHDLRHTFGSRLGMAGTDTKTIMEIMGHKTHKMAMRYQHPAPDHKLAAVRFLDTPPKVTTGQIIPF